MPDAVSADLSRYLSQSVFDGIIETDWPMDLNGREAFKYPHISARRNPPMRARLGRDAMSLRNEGKELGICMELLCASACTVEKSFLMRL